MILASGMHCNIDDLTAIYADRKVAQAILDDAAKHETIALIESGTCNLPEPNEAREFARVKKIEADFGKTPLGRAMMDNPLLHNYLASLNDRVAAMEEANAPKTPHGHGKAHADPSHEEKGAKK